jgi:hypothetical protein
MQRIKKILKAILNTCIFVVNAPSLVIVSTFMASSHLTSEEFSSNAETTMFQDLRFLRGKTSMLIFWLETQYEPAGRYQCFGRTYCLHLQS